MRPKRPHLTVYDGYVVLHLAIAPQNDAWRYYDILADIAVLTYLTTRHNVREMPNLSAIANRATFINIG